MNERSIFAAALDIIDSAERAAYLDKACDGDSSLRRNIEDLLAAQSGLGSFLGRPPAVLERTSDYTPLAEGPGSRVGPYKLLQEIGEGGMGTVFMAEQEEPIRRMVALKIIRAGMDSKSVLARFEAERQALALMDHPNIAKVFDAGTTQGGSPYFVMELVKGIPITKFCDENHLSLRQRLELFLPVCQAIQHAHMKGIIHRDIKPSNVLVAMYDDVPVPKIIDFGVAKATSQKLTDKTMFTAFGAVVGTLQYMSPEQAKLNQLDIDTRSDVYALGVLLYELLTGSTPLDRARLKSAALDEVLRLIREEEPPKPSTRISTTAALPQIAANRGSAAGQLGKLIRGELDWIVMKSLEKDRTRRYDTATSLAKDLQRYLAGDAVEACPPTLSYRMRKAYRKNRGVVLAGSAFAAVLMVGIVVASLLAIKATRAETLALTNENAARDAEQIAIKERDEKDKALSAETTAKQAEIEAKTRLQSSVAAERQAAYDMTIPLVQKAIRENDYPRATSLLSSCPEKLRGWEWHFLNRQFERGVVTLRPGYSKVRSVSEYQFTADGKYLINCEGSRVLIRDAMTGVEKRIIDFRNNPEATGNHVQASPDGRLLAVSTRSEPDRQNEPIAKLDEPKTNLAADPKRFDVTLVSFETGKRVAVLEKLSESVRSILFSPDATRIATCGKTNEVKVWNDHGKFLHALKCKNANQAVPVLFTPDAKTLVTNSVSGMPADLINVDGTFSSGVGEFIVWDLETGARRASGEIAPYTDNKGSSTTTGPLVPILPGGKLPFAKVSPDGKYAIGLASDAYKFVVDLQTGKEVFRFTGNFIGIGLMPNGQILAINKEAVCATFEITSGKIMGSYALKNVRTLLSATLMGRSADISKDGRWLTLYYRDEGFVEVREASTGKEIRSVPTSRYLFGNSATGTTINPSGTRLLTSMIHGEVKLWDLTASEIGTSHKLQTSSVFSPAAIATSQDGRWIAMQMDNPVKEKPGTRRELLEIFDLRNNKSRVFEEPLGEYNPIGSAQAVFSPDGRKIVSLAGPHLTGGASFKHITYTPLIWDVESGKLEIRGQSIPIIQYGFFDDRHVAQLAYSSDGIPLVAYHAIDENNSGRKVWRIREIVPEGKPELVRATIPTGAESVCRLSADGRFAAVIGRSNDCPAVEIWDCASKRILWSVPCEMSNSPALDGFFSNDGQRLLLTNASWGNNNGLLMESGPRVTVRDSQSGRIFGDFHLPITAHIQGLSISPDGRRLFWLEILPGKSKSAVFNADTGRELLSNFDAHSGPSAMAMRAVLTPEGYLVSGWKHIQSGISNNSLNLLSNLMVWDGRKTTQTATTALNIDEMLTEAHRLTEDPDIAKRNPTLALGLTTQAGNFFPNQLAIDSAHGLALLRSKRHSEAVEVLLKCVIREEANERSTTLVNLNDGRKNVTWPAQVQRSARDYFLLALATAGTGDVERAKIWFAWGETRLVSPTKRGAALTPSITETTPATERSRAEPFRQEAAKVLGIQAGPITPIDIDKVNADPALAGNRLMGFVATINEGNTAIAVWATEFLLTHSTPESGLIYNAACNYSLASGKAIEKKKEYAERAMELLNMAVSKGWKKVEQLKKDSDLDPIRDRNDFKELIAELERKPEPLPPPRELK